MRSRSIPIALAIVLVSLACGAPLKVKTTPADSPIEDPGSPSRRSSGFSRDTDQLLHLYDLDGQLPKNPTGAIVVLSGLRGQLRRPALAAQAEVSLQAANRTAGDDTTRAAGWYLLAAARSYEYLFGGDQTAMERALDPSFQRMRRIYNSAVGSYLSYLKESAGEFTSRDQASRFEFFHVEIDNEGGTVDSEACDALFLSRDLEVKGLSNRYRRPGVGASLIAFNQNRQTTPLDRYRPPEGLAEPATAILRFGPRAANFAGMTRLVTITFYDPRVTEEVDLAGWKVPLQADFTTHYAYQASISAEPGQSRKGLLNPEDHLLHQGLFMVDPYDPSKIPVIMVHGLKSSPLAWADLTNDLYGEPDLRNRYQFWHYKYPTGMPYLYVGMVMRAKLQALRVEVDPEGDDPAMRSIVIVAHSMGGLVTRSLVCDSGMEIWNTIFSATPEELIGTPQDLEWMEDMFIFEPKTYVSRVVFIATPHKGSDAAAGVVGQIGSSMVKLPAFYVERVNRIATANLEMATPEAQTYITKRAPTSIQAMRPQHPILKTLGLLPIDSSIPYHSIIGDRGKGADGGEISDGWVGYDSAHLEGAQSELIVPARHDAYSHPETIAEIKRILQLHLEEGR